MNNQDYFAKDFDPNKVTIKRLKEILNAHNISYKDISRKAEFVQKFQEHVLPGIQKKRVEKEQKRSTELQEQKTAKVRKSVTEQRYTEEEIKPSASVSQTKTSPQRKRKVGRASNKKQKETTPLPHIIQDDGQSSKAIVIDDNVTNNRTQLASTSQLRQNYSERISPPRPLKTPTSETPFYPMVPPYSRTPMFPFLEPEELEKVKLKDQELQQLSERQETPREISENRTALKEDKTKYFERREAYAYCFKPRAPKRNIDRRPPPEFIKRKRRIRLSSGIFVGFFTFVLVFLYSSLKVEIGFCDNTELPITDHDEGENMQSLNQLINNIMCTQCPPKATCSGGIISECEKGYKRETSFFRLTKPYYTHCVIDKDLMSKTKRYAKEFKEIVARETGRFECGYNSRESLVYENLILQLKEKMSPQDYEYINDTYTDILQDKDIYNDEYDNGSHKVYIYSRKPTYSFYCKLTNAFTKFIENVFENLFYSLAVMSTLFALLFGTLYIRQWIWEKRQVSIAFNLALKRLSENKRVIGPEFREEAFAHVNDPVLRLKLFQKLDEKIRANPYVRAGNARYDGYEACVWEWKAPSTSYVNPRYE